MPIYEYQCPACGHHEEQLDSKPSQYHRCHCGRYLVHVMSVSNFKIKGYSYANGYTRKDTNE